MAVSPRHIYWFAHYNLLGPCTRYRGKYLLEQLAKDYNLSYQFVYPTYRGKPLYRFVTVYLSALLFRKKHAVIVFQKTYTTGLYAALLRLLLHLRPTNTYYDIDDAYYVKFPPQTIHYFLKHAATIITGSTCLSQYATRISGVPQKVHTLPSPILKQTQTSCADKHPFTIGWAGFYNHHRDSLLQLLFPAIKQIHFRCRLVLLGVVKAEHFREISEYFSAANQVEVLTPEDIDWLNETEFYRWVRSFDVGVSPLLDSEMNRAKSAFKLKQYLCCGVPVIGSDTGENASIIQPNTNGYIANDSASFLRHINTIHQLGPVEKQAIQQAAIQSVQPFEMENYARDFLNLVQNTMKP